MRRIKNRLCRVICEPELEEDAALWTIAQTREMVIKLERWLHQLKVKLFIMERDYRRACTSQKSVSLKAVPKETLERN